MNRKLPRCKSLASVTSRFVMMLRDVDEVGAAHPDGPGRAIRLRCVTSAGRRRRRRIPNAAAPRTVIDRLCRYKAAGWIGW